MILQIVNRIFILKLLIFLFYILFECFCFLGDFYWWFER